MKNRTKNDLIEFVEFHNNAVLSDRPSFTMNVFGIDRIFSTREFLIKLNESHLVDLILNAQFKIIEREEAPYCTCKIEYVVENICPCMMVLDEIEANGECSCSLFLKDEELTKELLPQTVKISFIRTLNQIPLNKKNNTTLKQLNDEITALQTDYNKGELVRGLIDERLEAILSTIATLKNITKAQKRILHQRVSFILEQWEEKRIMEDDLFKQIEKVNEMIETIN